MPAVTDSQKISSNWKRASSIYPVYLALSKQFELGLPSCGDLEAGQNDNKAESLVRAEQWFRDADHRIEVHHLRELLNQAPLDERVLQALLTRHLGKEPKNESDRDKIDFLLVQYLAQCLPAKVPANQLTLEQVAEVLKPILGQASKPNEVGALEDCIRDLNLCRTLAEFLEKRILERGRAVKTSAQEKPFDPTCLVAFTRFSFLVRLGSIRLLHEDLDALEEDLKKLEKAGGKRIDCRSAGLSERESFVSLRRTCAKWRRFFPGKYTQNHWFSDVVSVRASVKRQLEQPAVANPEAKTSHAKVGALPVEDEIDRYTKEITELVKSMKETRAANTIKLSDTRAMLSFEEIRAFQRPSSDMDRLLQRVVAVRTVVLAAADKHSQVTPEAAHELALSEVAVLQQQIEASKEKGDTEGSIHLTACARSLQKALDKAAKAATA